MNPCRFCFRKGHSTSHALIYSINHIQEALKKKKHVLGLFIDPSKAFDTIDHKPLLHKLNHYEIRGNANMLLESYLSNRVQYIQYTIYMHLTKILKSLMSSMVSHREVFLALFYYLYQLQNCSDLGKFIIFADETNIFVCDDIREEVAKKANSVLTAVSSDMYANILHINMKKCCYMHFKPKIITSIGSQENNNQHTRIRINHYEIDE